MSRSARRAGAARASAHENLAAYDAFLKGEEVSASIGVSDSNTLSQ